MSWQEVLSNEVLDIRDGTHDSPKYLDSGYPLITSKNLKQGIIDFSDVSLISEEDYNNINKRSRVNKGDILYSMIGSIGNYALVNKEPHYAIKNVALFKFIDKRLHNKYFLHLINSFVIERQIKKAMKGGTQKFVSLKILRNLKIPLPPLDQQKKIAAILDAADGYRQKTKALIEKYDELTQSLFLDMFGDTWLNPNEYKLQKLSELVNEGKIITYGIVQAGDHVEDGIPYIRTGDIKNGKINTQGLLRTSQEIANSYMRSKCSAGDIIMSIRATVGTIAFLPDEMDGANLTQGTARISTDDKLANPLFLYHCIKSRGIQLRIDQQTKGATFREIPLTRLRNIEIPLPNLDLQNQFAERVQAIEAQKAQAQASLAQAEDLFNSLLQRAFKGELS